MTRPTPMMSSLLAIALLSLCCARAPSVPAPSSIMPLLASHPPPTVADTIPAGVASIDGTLCFVSSPGGIAALDTGTGATAWTTSEAQVPILALPAALLAIRGADPVDGAWVGPGALVAIDLAAPHAARSGAPFDLPMSRHRLLDVRIDGGALVAGWHASPTQADPLLAQPDGDGSIRIDLASGAAAITAESQVPETVRQALASVSAWRLAWRTHGGWSALVIGGSATALSMTLRHWPDTGAERVIPLLDHLDASTSALHTTARHAFVRTRSPASPAYELHAYDAETGARMQTLADPVADHLGPPFALVGNRWLAVKAGDPGRDRALVATDADHPAGPSWRHPLAPEPPPDLRH